MIRITHQATGERLELHEDGTWSATEEHFATLARLVRIPVDTEYRHNPLLEIARIVASEVFVVKTSFTIEEIDRPSFKPIPLNAIP